MKETFWEIAAVIGIGLLLICPGIVRSATPI